MSLEIDNPTDYQAALYIRLSREDEKEGPSESIVNQQSLLYEFAERHHLFVFDTYIDDGYSGTCFERPAFQRMIMDIENKKINMVITKDLSRLGRDYIMTGHYMERYFPEHQVRYISLLDGIDTGVDSVSNDITPFRAIMNDMYAKDISKKIKSVKRDKQRKGEFIGGKPVYGYRMDPMRKNKIVIDKQAALVVRRIFGMALAGMSCRKIASVLNEENVLTPAAYCGRKIGRPGPYTGKWSGERISEMLKNETYIGNMVQGRTVKISYKSKKCVRQPKEKWVVVEGTHEPLIEKEIFQKVQMMIDSRRHTRRRTYDFLLKGMIFCHECGYPMAVINRKNAAGEDRLFFICRTYQRFTKAGVCTCHSIKEETVNKAVLNKVQEVCEKYIDPISLQAVAEEVVRSGQGIKQSEAEILTLKYKISELTDHLDRIYEDRLNGIVLEDDFRRIYDKVKNDRTYAQLKLKRLYQQLTEVVNIEETAGNLVKKFLDSALVRRELLISLVERIELTEEKDIIIKFRFKKI